MKQVALLVVFAAVVAPQHPDANSDAALIPMKQRQFTKTWVAKPFGDDIKKAFSDNVLLK